MFSWVIFSIHKEQGLVKQPLTTNSQPTERANYNKLWFTFRKIGFPKPPVCPYISKRRITMRKTEAFLSYALIILTFLSCFAPVFAYACVGTALAIVMDSLSSHADYETIIDFNGYKQVPAAAWSRNPKTDNDILHSCIMYNQHWQAKGQEQSCPFAALSSSASLTIRFDYRPNPYLYSRIHLLNNNHSFLIIAGFW